MENRYQKFLSQTLRAGLWELQKNPSATEVIGIPIKTFDLLIQSFRSDLSEELKTGLPEHDLKNLGYVQALLNKIDILLSPGVPETITLSNISTLPDLMARYNQEKLKTTLEKQQVTWKEKLDRQIEEYNRRLFLTLEEEIKESLPSLSSEKRKMLVADVSQTIINQGLPAIESVEQTRSIVEEVAKQTISHYASEIEELRSRPEISEQLAKTVAKEQEAASWKTRVNQILASGTASTVRQIDLMLQETIINELPEIYQKQPKIVQAITQQVLSRTPALAQQPTLETFQKVLAEELRSAIKSGGIQQLLQEVRASIPEKQQKTFSSAVSRSVGNIIQEWANSPEATIIGGMPAAAAAAMPRAAPAAGIPEVELVGEDFKGRLKEGWGAVGSPTGFLFFGFSRPSLATIPTTLLGFGLDIVGVVPSVQPYMLAGFLSSNEAELKAFTSGYQQAEIRARLKGNLREAEAYKNLASFAGTIAEFKAKAPGWAKPFIALGSFYGRIQDFNIRIARATGFTPLQILRIISKYDLYGAGYIVETGAKLALMRLSGAALHALLPNLFPYDRIAREVYFKYGPKGIIKATRNLLFEKLGKGVVGKAFKALLEKLGLSALLGALSGGASLAVQVGWAILKKIWKWIVGGLGIFLIWLITQLGTVAGIITFGIGAVGGAIIGWAIGGPVGAAIGFFVGPIITGLIAAFVKNLFFPEGAVVGAGGLGGGIGAVPSLAPYATPILATAGAAIVIPTTIYFIVTSSAFVIPGQPSPVQSLYIEVQKAVNFSGNLGEPINYTLTVIATRGRLTNIKITDTTNLTCQRQPPTVPERTFAGQVPDEIAPGAPLALTYQVQTNQQFNDCLVTNTVQVTADVPDEGKTGEQSFTTANLTIGNPPIVAPQGLPLRGNVCLSGYDFSERGARGFPHEGIDIISDQLTVYSTFPRESRVVNVCPDSKDATTCLSMPGGYSITLGLGPYTIYFAHLQTPPEFEVGDQVPAFGVVGIMGDTGTSALGAHVHYMIQENGTPVNPHSFGANPPKCP